jgi:hypothetical protein
MSPKAISSPCSGPNGAGQDHADRHRHLAGDQVRRSSQRVRPRPRH